MANFNSTDFISDYQDLLDLVKKLTNKWDPSTSTEADPGVVLLKLAALMKDKISYKQDMSEAQAYLDTVSDRQSAFELLQMLGYILKNKKSTIGTVSLSLSSSYTDAAEINLKSFETTFSDIDSSKTYFLLNNATLFQNSTVMANIMEGSPFYIEKEGIDVYDIKDIDDSGRFYLGKSGLAQNGVFIGLVDETGEEDYQSWLNLDASVLYPTGRYFFVLTSSTGENYIQFPQNVSELLGSSKFKIRATYSLGASGNIKAGTLVKINLSDKNIASAIRVFQGVDFTSGQDEETISQGVQNYYDSQEVFNTLITSHDFQAAVRKVLSDVNIGATSYAFSNAFASTAIDRQLQVVSRFGNESFDYYSSDDSTSYKIVNVGCLKSSDVYDESFEFLGDSDESTLKTEAQITSQLKNSATIGTSFKLDTSGYIKNIAIPTGIVFVNADTAEEQEEILQNIITTLKSKYSAKNLTFGKEIDYSELVKDIFSSDSRILNVNLNTLEYTPNIVTALSKVPVALSTSEKENIAAEAIINGQVPLYKFLNRRNTSSVAALNLGFINQGLGMTKYKKLENNKLLKITVEDNGFSWLKNTEGKTMKSFSSLNVLQLRRPLYIEDTIYGYGTTAIYTSAEPNSIQITSKTTLMQGSVIAAGSVVTLDPTASEGIVKKYPESPTYPTGFKKITDDTGAEYYYCSALPENYTVTKYIDFYLATGEHQPLIAPNSIISSGSYLNGVVYSQKTLEVSDDRVLQANESLTMIVKGASTIYGSGTHIKISGGTLVSNTSTVLGSSMTVSILKESESVIDKGLKYFVVSNNPSGFLFTNNEYMLEENEFFVYSNENLSEYLILGAGTLLTYTTGADGLLLDNVQTSEERNNLKGSSFKNLPVKLVAKDMELSTFSEGYTINNIKSNITTAFNDITEDIEVYKVTNDGVESSAYLTFKSNLEYKARMCVMLRPDINGTLNFTTFGSMNIGKTTGVKLKLTQDNEEIYIESATTATDGYDCLLFSNIRQYFISNELNIDLSSEKLEMAVCVYRKQNDTQDAIESASISPRNIVINLNSGADTTVTFNVDSFESNAKGAAVLFRILLPVGASVKLNQDTDDNVIKKVSGNLVTAIYKLKAFSSTLTFTFSNVTKVNQVATISDYSIITGYSDELGSAFTFSNSLLSDKKQPLLGGAVEAAISNLLSDNLASKYFDVLATPRGDYFDPIDASSYFNYLHPRNYKTLPYLSLDSDVLSSHLRVVPIRGRTIR